MCRAGEGECRSRCRAVGWGPADRETLPHESQTQALAWTCARGRGPSLYTQPPPGRRPTLRSPSSGRVGSCAMQSAVRKLRASVLGSAAPPSVHRADKLRECPLSGPASSAGSGWQLESFRIEAQARESQPAAHRIEASAPRSPGRPHCFSPLAVWVVPRCLKRGHQTLM